MIPGVLRGVIASSWLRAADDLRAPNAITTGQNIPKVFVRQITHQQSEFALDTMMPPLSIQRPNLGISTNFAVSIAILAPLLFTSNSLAVIRKV